MSTHDRLAEATWSSSSEENSDDEEWEAKQALRRTQDGGDKDDGTAFPFRKKPVRGPNALSVDEADDTVWEAAKPRKESAVAEAEAEAITRVVATTETAATGSGAMLLDEPDEDAAWAATQGQHGSDSDSDDEDKPWNNFRRTHRLTEIAQWKSISLTEQLLTTIRAYSKMTTTSDMARINEPLQNSSDELKQAGLDIFYLSNGYCVTTTSFDTAEKYRAAKRKEVQRNKQAGQEATSTGTSIEESANTKQQLQQDTTTRFMPAPKMTAPPRTSSSLAEQLRLRASKRKSLGTTAAAASVPIPMATPVPVAVTNIPNFTACSDSSSDNDESDDAGDNGVRPLTTFAFQEFCSAELGSERPFALDSWGEERSMDAFDELVQKGWTMQLFAQLQHLSQAGTLPRPGPTDTVSLSYAASWWHDGTQARVHRVGKHICLQIGQRKCLPAIEEAIGMVPFGFCAEIVVGQSQGAIFSIFGPQETHTPPDEHDNLVVRVQLHEKQSQ